MLLLVDLWKPLELKILPLPTQASLKAWRILQNPKVSDIKNKDVHFPIQVLETLNMSSSVRQLLHHGITEISVLISGQAPKSLFTMMGKYGLPITEHLNYICIYHFLSTHAPPLLDTCFTAWRFYMSPIIFKKGILLFYNVQQDKRIHQNQGNFPMGGRPTGILYTFHVDFCLFSLSQVTHCVNHWELAIKISSHWYCTPFPLLNPSQHPLNLAAMWENW